MLIVLSLGINYLDLKQYFLFRLFSLLVSAELSLDFLTFLYSEHLFPEPQCASYKVDSPFEAPYYPVVTLP